jgi:hypothetical protein
MQNSSKFSQNDFLDTLFLRNPNRICAMFPWRGMKCSWQLWNPCAWVSDVGEWLVAWLLFLNCAVNYYLTNKKCCGSIVDRKFLRRKAAQLPTWESIKNNWIRRKEVHDSNNFSTIKSFRIAEHVICCHKPWPRLNQTYLSNLNAVRKIKYTLHVGSDI